MTNLDKSNSALGYRNQNHELILKGDAADKVAEGLFWFLVLAGGAYAIKTLSN